MNILPLIVLTEILKGCTAFLQPKPLLVPRKWAQSYFKMIDRLGHTTAFIFNKLVRYSCYILPGVGVSTFLQSTVPVYIREYAHLLVEIQGMEASTAIFAHVMSELLISIKLPFLILCSAIFFIFHFSSVS